MEWECGGGFGGLVVDVWGGEGETWLKPRKGWRIGDGDRGRRGRGENVSCLGGAGERMTDRQTVVASRFAGGGLELDRYFEIGKGSFFTI
jgi:hypothetical protein